MGLESWQVGGNSGTIAGYKGKKVREARRGGISWGQSMENESHKVMRSWDIILFSKAMGVYARSQ